MLRLVSIVVALACWPAAAAAQLTATDEMRLAAPASQADSGDELGAAVDVEGSTIIAGAPGRDGSTTLVDAGAAYVWVGILRRQILPATRSAQARFGASVGVDGTTAVVGAPSESHVGSGTEEGAVYLYGFSESEWGQSQRITAGDDAAAGDMFGHAVAIDGNTLVVGVPGRASLQGAVYVYTRDATTWTLAAVLEAPVDDRGSERAFGATVALSGDVLVVGSYSWLYAAAETVHVFERSGTTWSHAAMLQASDSTSTIGYGYAVAVDGDRIAVGAPAIVSGSGAVYLYERTGGIWSPTQKLTHAGTKVFGGAVAIDGDLLVVGAPGTSSNAGRAHTFLRSVATGAWSHASQSPAAAPSADILYGHVVALDGRRAAIGAHRADVESTSTGWDDGAVFPVTYELANGAECTDRSAALCASTFCTDGVCCATVCAGACSACSEAAGAMIDGECALTPGVECRAAADACDVAEMCGTTSACPEDVRMTDCSFDAGPVEVDGGALDDDAGMTADAGSDTVPRRTLSCTCRAGLDGGSAPGPIAALIATLALAMTRRRR